MTFPETPDQPPYAAGPPAPVDPPGPPGPTPRKRRRTVLVSHRWAASAAVVAAMSLGAGALAPQEGTQSERSGSPVRSASSATELPYVSSTVTEAEPSASEESENTPTSE